MNLLFFYNNYDNLLAIFDLMRAFGEFNLK